MTFLSVQQIQQQTGAAVIARGRFRPPHEANLPVTNAADRPLYLRVSAGTQKEFDAAVERVNVLMKGEVTHRVRNHDRSTLKGQHNGDLTMCPHVQPTREEFTTKVFVGIDLSEARKMNFNYVGKIIGPKVHVVLLIGFECTTDHSDINGGRVHM